MGDRLADEAEGIWSSDIEQCFLEALVLYPPCGRRKIILTDEGKVYGRNELVARYIKIRTGKIRTRKQVSSHLQVLMKRRSKELQMLRQDKEARQIILDRFKQATYNELTAPTTENKQPMITDDQNRFEISSMAFLETESNLISTNNLVHSLVKGELPIGFERSANIEDPSLALNPDTPSNNRSQSVSSVTSLPQPIIQEVHPKSTLLTTNSCPTSNLLSTSPAPYSYSTDQSYRSPSDSSLSSSSPSRSAGFIHMQLRGPVIRQLALIGDKNFHLYDLSAFIELKRTSSSSLLDPYAEISSIHQHDLVRLYATDVQMQSIQRFETISIDQISDKFPAHGGLKDLFDNHPKGPFFLIKFWADMSFSLTSMTNLMYHRDESFFTSYTYTSCSYRPIQVSTRLCSFGKQVLEKVEICEHPHRDPFDQFIYRFDRSPLCDYMVQFIQKLRSLPNISMMNSVLENFTVLQAITCRDDAQRLLLCLAFVFEVATLGACGPQYQVYKLVNS